MKYMDRSSARAAAMKLVYEWEMGGDGGVETEEGLLDIHPGENERDYMESLVAGVTENVSRIDDLIGKYAVGWTVNRMRRVDLSIMRIAVYEMVFLKMPAGIAVNEAVELARTYSAPEAAAFVNGVLGNLARGLQ